MELPYFFFDKLQLKKIKRNPTNITPNHNLNNKI